MKYIFFNKFDIGITMLCTKLKSKKCKKIVSNIKITPLWIFWKCKKIKFVKKYILEFRMLNIIFKVEEFANIKKNSIMILEKNNIWSIYFLINLILGLQCYAQN